jgi:acetyl/propionyl-CoA carboxylase alpha subunit
MTFEIEIAGRAHVVAVEKAGPPDHRFRVTVDGLAHLVDAVRVEDDTLSLIFSERGYESCEVGFAEGLVPGELDVYLHTGTLKAFVNGRRSRRAAEAAAVGEQRVVAPMPGKVLRVLVTPGQEVAVRQPLVVVEAMKMENELTSPKSGRIKEIAVTEGSSVEAGRLLVVVE